MSDKVLIEFVADTTNLEQANSSIEKLGATEQKVLQEMNSSIAKNNAEQKASTENINKTTKSVQDLAKAAENAQKAAMGDFGKKAFQELIGLIEGNTNELEQLQQAIALSKEGLKMMTDPKDIQQFSQKIAQAEAYLQEFEQTTVGAGQKQASFRTQIRQSREEIAQLLASGKLTTSQLYEMAKGTGELKDALGDANQAIGVLSSDTFVFDSMLQSIQSLAAGFQIGQGAVALFGSENEDLQKVLVKLNAVMAITQGLQQILNATQKNTAQSLGLSVLWNKLLGNSYDTLTGEVIVATTATKAFRLALISTGIGAIVLLLFELYSNFDKVKAAITGIFPGLKNLGQYFNNFKAIATGVFDAIIPAIKTYGKILYDVFTLNWGEIKEDFKKGGEEVAKAYYDGVARSRRTDELNKIIEDSKKILERLDYEVAFQKAKGNEKLALKLNLQAKSAALDKAAAEYEKEKNSDNLKAYQDAAVDLQQAVTDTKAFQKKQLEDAEKERKEAQRKALEARKREIEDEIAVLERKRIEQSKDAAAVLEIDKQLINKRAELAKVGELSTAKIKLIDAQSVEAQKKLLEEFYKKQRELNNQAQTKILEDSITVDNAYINERLQSVEKGTQEEYNLRVELLENQKALDTLAILQSTASEEVKLAKLKDLNTKYISDKNALMKTQLDYELTQALAFQNAFTYQQVKDNETAVNNEKLTFEQRKQAVQNLSQFKLANIKIERIALEDQLANGVISQQEYNDKIQELANKEYDIQKEKAGKITAIEQEEAAKRKEILDQLQDVAFQSAQKISDGIFAIKAQERQQDLDAALNALNKKRDTELANKNLTEAQKQRINDRYAKEELALKKRAFDQDQNMKAVQAGINAALAVTMAFAQLGPIGGAIATIGILAAMAVEIATIKTAKFPGYKEGTEYVDGPGDGKSDSIIARLSKGERIVDAETNKLLNGIPNKMLPLLLSGIRSDIMTGYELKSDLISHPDIPTANSAIIEQSRIEKTTNNYQSIEIDYDRLGEVVGNEVAKHPRTNINIDKNGFQTYVQQGNTTTYIVNNKYIE